ncbi:MAG: thiamine pyrophosphate-dependent dehydrogenase E1 component subunit alpha [Deltaproteobacteria bacterium]|nr:thiamine pyrophosphate-dependent dehydrogenase E1 component subunit alpha [Deltaproteobacteria bacterium]
MLHEIPREKQLGIMRAMLLIRRAEEQVIHFNEDYTDLIRGHFHVYIGQEGTGASVCAALEPEDYLFTTHRNHGHVIAKGGDPKRVLAEIIGRETGYCRGRAGTFHVAAPELGILHTSAIVGGCLPLAAGTAFASQVKKDRRVTIVFFGDGAMEEGAFYEVLNIAKLWQLPLIFLMENNYRRSQRGLPSHAAAELAAIPRAFNVETRVIDGANAGIVYKTACELVRRARAGEGPFFVEARTHLWPGNYRALPKLIAGETKINWAWEPDGVPQAARSWHAESDPVLLFARELLKQGETSCAEIERLDREVREEVAEAARFALASPLPDPKAALDLDFAGGRDN